MTNVEKYQKYHKAVKNHKIYVYSDFVLFIVGLGLILLCCDLNLRFFMVFNIAMCFYAFFDCVYYAILVFKRDYYRKKIGGD